MIQTASLVGLVKTVLIIILAYSIIKYITRLLAPWILRSMAKKINKPPSNYNSSNERDVSIDKSVKKQRSVKDVGEYVDYEELD